MDSCGQLEIKAVAPGWPGFHDLCVRPCLDCGCQSYTCRLAAPSSLADSSISGTKERERKGSKQANVCSLILSNEEELLLELNTIGFCLEVLYLPWTWEAWVTNVPSKCYFQGEIWNEDNCRSSFFSCYNKILKTNFRFSIYVVMISGTEWCHPW